MGFGLRRREARTAIPCRKTYPPSAKVSACHPDHTSTTKVAMATESQSARPRQCASSGTVVVCFSGGLACTPAATSGFGNARRCPGDQAPREWDQLLADEHAEQADNVSARLAGMPELDGSVTVREGRRGFPVQRLRAADHM